ncbi:hypothetical protein M0812_09948 [Anaeramoeba flamelloides]|uniref:Uncharacterized protein n=1 Tax=Anaeramoeba flamelloides TaxID=1746091 RepID=A0AAV7ZQ05_9EUKA|nr:hypothetical protein M0812_09948 [Anaeramoeba flamelloides]
MNFARRKYYSLQELSNLKNYINSEKEKQKQFQSLLKIKETLQNDLKVWKEEEGGVTTKLLTTLWDERNLSIKNEKKIQEETINFITVLQNIVQKYKEWEVVQKKHKKAVKSYQNAFNKQKKAELSLEKATNPNKKDKLEMEVTTTTHNCQDARDEVEKLEKEKKDGWLVFQKFQKQNLKRAFLSFTSVHLEVHQHQCKLLKKNLNTLQQLSSNEKKKSKRKGSGNEKKSTQQESDDQGTENSFSEDEDDIVNLKEIENLKDYIPETDDDDDDDDETTDDEDEELEKNYNKKKKLNKNQMKK